MLANEFIQIQKKQKKYQMKIACLISMVFASNPCDFEGKFTNRDRLLKLTLAYRMRFGEKCKEKTTKMTEDSPRVTDLINNANFLLNVSILCHFCTQIDGNYHER